MTGLSILRTVDDRYPHHRGKTVDPIDQKDVEVSGTHTGENEYDSVNENTEK